ncbi:MAG: penicillin-binding protein [Labilithrix sp.]|nr:penicillin-binding protein [Labilithrix sp.]MBX3213711.1 penicillin-binding protein [Labilithrix sp.]
MLRALPTVAAFWLVLTIALRAGAEVPSVDERLQASAARWLRTAAPHEGAIVMSDVKTGRVLAWASLGGGDRVGAAFAPVASVFKLATVSALLDSGHASGGSIVCYAGGEHSIDASDLREEPRPGDACVPLRTAVGHSINVAVAKLAVRHARPDEVQTKAALLGFDGVVPIDRDVGRSKITIPDERLGFARAAAGFWNGRTSALGALFAVQTIANGGARVRLHTGTKSPARVEAGRAMRAETAAELARMMTITTRSGTAAKVFRKGKRPSLDGVAVAAKTGTLIGDKPARMYSWFAGFAPANAPEVAVSVVLANDVTWRMKGNEVGREVLADYFRARAEPARRVSSIRGGAQGRAPPPR